MSTRASTEKEQEEDELKAERAPSHESPTDGAPDGGLRAWLQVLAAHLVIFNSFGYINSFGIFQPYYVDVLQKDPSTISWIGSIEIFLVYFVGTFSGRAMDAGFFYVTISIGLLMQLIGVFTTSISKEYWQLFLAQGLCQGIGNGLLFCPIIALISTYFNKKRAVAIALQASGGGTGGLVFPAIAQRLLYRIGFAWTVRIMGFVMLFNSAVILALIRVRPYAGDILHVSTSTTFNLLLLLNGTGIPGRILPALIADRFLGPLNTFIPVSLFGGLMLFCWIAVRSLDGMWAFVAFFGFPGGGVQSLFPASLSTLSKDVNTLGVRIGMVFSVISFATLSGPPIAGRLIDAHGGSFLNAQIFGGICMVLGSVFLFAARVAVHGFVLKKRV
ncbi:MAG: hypothetical protein M1831_007455 [Alyxoria varia]|nr:MAG: hypothetical protein M1831_007455 [Alyxoria varia]